MNIVASCREIPMTSGEIWYQPLVHDPDGPILREGRIYKRFGHARNAGFKVRFAYLWPNARYPRKSLKATNRAPWQNYSRTYRIWRNMLSRCYNPLCPSYKYYGAKSVIVCDQWLDYGTFYHDVNGPIPPGLSIDRIDPSGNYEPGNIRLADAKMQANNKRNSRRAGAL